MTDENRPGPDATPFRIVLYAAGERRSFPMFADAAYDNATRAIRWQDPPFSGAILDALGDREVLMGSIVRVFANLAEKAEGTCYFTDDDGHEWGILARTINAVEVEDPDAKHRKRQPTAGFKFEPPTSDA